MSQQTSTEAVKYINWLREVEDIPKVAVDPLAKEVMRRFNGAVAWQSTEQVNGKSLRTVLTECWEQMSGTPSCDARQRAEALGVDITVNLTALKVGIATSYLNDSLTSGTSQLPWTIIPTPRPDLSEDSKKELLEALRDMVAASSFADGRELIEVIRQGKLALRTWETEKAEKCAAAMMTLMEDQCAEGGFHRALSSFVHNFAVYPFAVFIGPILTKAPRLVWRKNTPVVRNQVFPTFRAISPFDFAYSSDSPDTQRGTCVFTRTLWTRKELHLASTMDSYIASNIKDVLAKADTDHSFNLDWLSKEPDANRDLDMWRSNVSPVEVLTHYGIFSGRELSDYKLSNIDKSAYYHAEVAMVGGRVIQVRVANDKRLAMRPVHTASFYRTGDRIAGDGIAQRLRDVERAYQANLAYLMRNAANASAPICEADYRRISKYMGDDEIGSVVPGSMYLTDSDVGSGAQPALRFFSVPSNIPAYAQLMEMFMALADRVTNIPAALHGEAVGSGAMRTFRGMSLLQGNATKALHAAVSHMANGVFTPLGQMLYNVNMVYGNDAGIKGDSMVITKGAEGILQKEIEKQTAMELLQVLGAVGAQLGQSVNVAPVVAWGLQKLFTGLGVPDDVMAQMSSPVGVPNGNPAPTTTANVSADVNGGAADGIGY